MVAAGAFADRVVAITGAGGGIGSALARRFARERARLALLDLNVESAEKVAEGLRAEGVDARAWRCDITDTASVEASFAEVRAAFGGVDVLVNNAGLTHRSPFAETDLEVLRRVMDVNYFGSVHCTHAALPSLAERRGQIVVISSVAGFAPLIGRTGYCASKHALHGFFDTLRAEMRPRGVGVLLVCPGFTDTPFSRGALGGSGAPAQHAPAPVGRLSSPDEVADQIVRAAIARRPLLVLTGVGKVSWWLSRVVPRIYERIMARTQRSELAGV